jgi:GGDEF domain-containing protein
MASPATAALEPGPQPKRPVNAGSWRRESGRTLAARVRLLLGAAGTLMLLLLAATMLIRGVDRIEVLAAVLYVVVFIGIVTVDVIGGSAAALLAGAVYAVLRFPAFEVLGTAQYASLILIRLLSYLAFGLIGGLAWKLIRERLGKLESFDVIDDHTTLLNARGLFELLDHEVARGRRYGLTFTIGTVSFPAEAFAALGRRRERALATFGNAARESVRSADRIGIVSDERMVTLVALFPQTDEEGAKVVLNRLGDSVRDSMLPEGVAVGRKVDEFVFSFPEQAVDLAAFKSELVARTRVEFPGAPEL